MPSKELQNIINMFKSIPRQEDISVEKMRRDFEGISSMIQIGPDIRLEPIQVDSVPAEWVIAPEASDERTILYLHGGGYVAGSINTHRELCSHISRASKARVLVLDYRLAPENPYPAAIEDSIAAYRWLLNEGVDPSRIAIAGDSAGGGLTVAALVSLKEKKEQLPAVSVCISPWTDLEGIGESMTTKADADPLVERGGLVDLAKYYLGDMDPRAPLVSPIYADLSGLPPMLIQVGTWEVLFSDSTRLAERAKEAGVDAILEPWEEMIHVWHIFASMLPEGMKAIERIGNFICKYIN